jgi:hypothetical protein
VAEVLRPDLLQERNQAAHRRQHPEGQREENHGRDDEHESVLGEIRDRDLPGDPARQAVDVVRHAGTIVGRIPGQLEIRGLGDEDERDSDEAGDSQAGAEAHQDSPMR